MVLSVFGCVLLCADVCWCVLMCLPMPMHGCARNGRLCRPGEQREQLYRRIANQCCNASIQAGLRKVTDVGVLCGPLAGSRSSLIPSSCFALVDVAA